MITTTCGSWATFVDHGQEAHFGEVIVVALRSHADRHLHFGWIPPDSLAALRRLWTACGVDADRFVVVDVPEARPATTGEFRADVLLGPLVLRDSALRSAALQEGVPCLWYRGCEGAPSSFDPAARVVEWGTLAELARMLADVAAGRWPANLVPRERPLSSSSSPEIICYALHVSHVLNLGRIPQLLQERGWRVRWLNAFGAEAFPAPLHPGIEYGFDVAPALLKRLTADLYVSPYVGQSGTFPERARRVHLLVSLTSLDGVYEDWMFDDYDVIACAGRHQIHDFERLARTRCWRHKCFFPMGYPKLDGQHRQRASSSLMPPDDVFTVVFAPTHGYSANQSFSILGHHGESLVERLLAEGRRVVFRPHAESWRDQDRHVVERIVTRLAGHPRFQLDRSTNYFDSYARSHAMITDISGTGFTYAFTFGRPAIFLAPHAESELGRRGIQFENRQDIGFVARSLDDVVDALRQVEERPDHFVDRIACFSHELLFQPGTSEAYFAEHAAALAEGLTRADWSAGSFRSLAASSRP